jgi:hypothetical protein
VGQQCKPRKYSFVQLAVCPRQPGSRVLEALCCDEHDPAVLLFCHALQVPNRKAESVVASLPSFAGTDIVSCLHESLLQDRAWPFSAQE